MICVSNYVSSSSASAVSLVSAIAMRGRSVTVLVVTIVAFAQCSLRTDQKYWTDLAENELEEALKVQWNLNRAKNVILFVGDGMGPNTVTATRIQKGGETHRLTFEKFPHVGLLKTYSANKMVPDSASTATAMFCGVKTNQETLGVDASVAPKDCAASLRPEARLQSLAALALTAGKSAGFVTTMRVTHATPAPLYAHSAERRWECDGAMPKEAAACKDHARQLVEDWPGRDLNVILGGGRQGLEYNLTGTDPLDTWSCRRNDGLNLLQEYKRDKERRGLKYSFVSNSRELKDVSSDTDYLLGLFANGHLKYEFERDKGPNGEPSISEMVDAALNVLERNEKGYFLMVEGGNIDMGHHRGRARTAINEAAAMENAVSVAAARAGPDTLLVVTSDHTHTLSINGYPYRGSNIFDVAGPSTHDGVNYTTLSYSTGGPGSMHYFVNGSQVTRREPDNTSSYYYEQVAGITLEENSHGGGDVVVYARGPHAHLFHNVHEQHYVFHALSYAARLGAYSNAPTVTPTVALLIAFLSHLVLM